MTPGDSGYGDAAFDGAGARPGKLARHAALGRQFAPFLPPIPRPARLPCNLRPID